MNHVGVTFRGHISHLAIIVSLIAATAHAAGNPLLTTPPPKPVRIPAEFEPMQGVIASTVMAVEDFAREVIEDANLIVLWHSEVTYDIFQRRFQEWGVDLDRCVFQYVPSHPTPRDELPWLMFVDQNEPALAYNKDLSGFEYVLPAYGLEQGCAVYRSGLGLPGGDFMTDGQGTAVSLDDFSIFHAEMGEEFGRRVRDYWGIDTYHRVPNKRWSMDGYLHIDCLAKFLSPDTVMVARVPVSDIRREQSEETAAYFRRQVSCYGTPYEVVRVDVPDREPYINSLICNSKVYVPMMDVAADANAIASYEAAMPGYEVIGIGHAHMWYPFFSLHCHTMHVPDAQMLYIEHTPILDRPATPDGFPIGARIIAHSRTEFVEGTPMVVWRVMTDADEPQLDNDTAASWTTEPMVRSPELGDHQYLAYIPSQPVGTVMQYYLRAQDSSGRDETHPYIGQPQAHTFTVTRLGANVSAVSAQRGGAIQIYMNAGTVCAGQRYTLIWSRYDDAEDSEVQIVVPPGMVTLSGFTGVLDDFGTGVARMILPGPLPVDWAGRQLRFSLVLEDSHDVTSDTVCIRILD